MTVTADPPVQADVSDYIQVSLLEDLATELVHRGVAAWVLEPPGRVPVLTAAHPLTGRESDVYAAPVHSGPDDGWWFWWPHAERIGPGIDVPAAARAVADQLAAAPGDE